MTGPWRETDRVACCISTLTGVHEVLIPASKRDASPPLQSRRRTSRRVPIWTVCIHFPCHPRYPGQSQERTRRRVDPLLKRRTQTSRATLSHPLSAAWGVSAGITLPTLSRHRISTSHYLPTLHLPTTLLSLSSTSLPTSLPRASRKMR